VVILVSALGAWLLLSLLIAVVFGQVARDHRESTGRPPWRSEETPAQWDAAEETSATARLAR